MRAGPDAIARYLAAEERGGRLVQSLKSFLASRLFTSTAIFGRRSGSRISPRTSCARSREAASAELGVPVLRAVCGRPVRFVERARAPRTRRSRSRGSRAALRNAGFRDVEFEYEPVGAAWHYERGLERDELILIADFGGGTSDFSLLRVGPASARPATARAHFSATTACRSRATRSTGSWCAISSRRCSGAAPSSARSSAACSRSRPGSTAISSAGITSRSCARRRRSSCSLDLRREALEPERLAALLHLVRNDLGFLLFRAVERTKRELSEGEAATSASSTRISGSTAP